MVLQLFIDSEKAYDLVMCKVLYNIGIPMKLIRLIKMSLNEIYRKVYIGKNLTHFLFRIVWNKKMLYHHCFSTLL
jgi:hypothetical protein